MSGTLHRPIASGDADTASKAEPHGVPCCRSRSLIASCADLQLGTRWRLLLIGAGLLGSVLLRVSLFDFQSVDYTAFLSNWYDSFIQHGRWHGIGEPAGQLPSYCYPPLYLYFISLSTLLPLPKLYAIKLLSVSADYLAAWYDWKLARQELPAGYRRWAIVVLFLFLPTIVMNSALWGQCDMMYTCGLLASLFYLLQGRPVAALVAFGFSCSLKPQAIFWCPFLAGLLASGRVTWKQIWIPVAVYGACALPAILAGRPIVDALTHWGSAAIKPMALVLGAPNWYQWVPEEQASAFYWIGVSLTLVATGAFVLRTRRVPPKGLSESRWLISMALLSVLFPPFFLPGVHERYFFAADVLSVVYTFCFPGQWIVVLLVQLASAFSYLPFLFQAEPIPPWLLAAAMSIAIGIVAATAFRGMPGLNRNCRGKTP